MQEAVFQNQFCGYSWSRMASIIRVLMGSFTNGMKFWVRIAYNLLLPFGVTARRFSSARRSCLVFIRLARTGICQQREGFDRGEERHAPALARAGASSEAA